MILTQYLFHNAINALSNYRSINTGRTDISCIPNCLCPCFQFMESLVMDTLSPPCRQSCWIVPWRREALEPGWTAFEQSHHHHPIQPQRPISSLFPPPLHVCIISDLRFPLWWKGLEPLTHQMSFTTQLSGTWPLDTRLFCFFSLFSISFFPLLHHLN